MAKKSSESKKKSSEPKKLYREPKKGMVAGVAAGMADYFNVDVTLMRVIFVIAAVLTKGLAVLAYIIMAVITPVRGAKSNEDLGEKVSNLAEEVTYNSESPNARNWFGLGLVALGSWLLLGVFWPSWFDINWGAVWPAILIVVGLLVLMRSRG